MLHDFEGIAPLERADGSEEPLRIDSSLREGDVVQLAADSLAHLRLDQSSGGVLGPGSELALVRMRTGETRLELRSGRIANQVQPLTAAQYFVVHEGTAGLQRCYERALKQRPDLDGRLTMRIAVSASGSVRQAQPRGLSAELPGDLVAYIRTVSAKWRFPATGSALTFDVPLQLSPR